MSKADRVSKRKMEWKTVADFPVRAIQWLWPGVFPLGKLSVVSGDPNVGKSFLTLDLAARTSAGGDWPDGRPNRPGRVMLLSAEDDVADTIRPRLERAGGRLDNVTVVAGRNAVSLPRDLPEIVRRAESLECRLIVIDPLTAYLDNIDGNNQRQARDVLMQLSRAAEQTEAAVVAVSHNSKHSQHAAAVYRTIGSLSFTIVARAVWTVRRDPGKVDRRLLLPVKMNIAPNPHGHAFRISERGVVDWEPEPIELTPDELCDDALADGDESDREKEAKIWLRRFLSGGRQASQVVKSNARTVGIPLRSLWRAKSLLKVPAYKEGACWFWCLPEHYVIQKDEHDFYCSGVPAWTHFPGPLPNLDAEVGLLNNER